MPRIATIALLPDDIRRQLDEQLQAQGYGGSQAAACWLRRQGFKVGKSAVAVHAARLKRRKAHEERLQLLDGPGLGFAQLRLQCVSVALAAGAADHELLKRADEVLKWALEPPA